MSDDVDLFPIPACIDQTHPECIALRATVTRVIVPEPVAGFVMPTRAISHGPTRAEKDALAMAVARVVKKGADTVGKVRKAMGDIEGLEKSLRRAIRMGLVAREGRRYYGR